MSKQQILLAEDLRGHKLIMDCPTRWNSTYSMLERLLEQTPAIMAVISDSSCAKAAANTLKFYAYSFDELSLVERLAAALKSFMNATNCVCGDKSPTLHKIIPLLIKLSKCVEIDSEDPTLIQRIKEKMKSELQRRTQDRELALMACMLNPFTKDLDFLPTEERLDAHQLLLRIALNSDEKAAKKIKIKKEKGIDDNDNELNEMQREPELPKPELPRMITEVESEDVEEVDGPSKAKKLNLGDCDEFLQDIVCVGESVKPLRDVIEQEVGRYIGASQCDTDLTILQWWKKNEMYYPRLSVLVKKYLAIPASSVPAERVFSLAGHLVNKKELASTHLTLTILFL